MKMKDEFQFEELTEAEKKLLLSAYDYSVDGEGNIIDDALNEKVLSKVTNQPLTLKNVALISGSLKLMDSDPLTISKFLREEIENEH